MLELENRSNIGPTKKRSWNKYNFQLSVLNVPKIQTIPQRPPVAMLRRKENQLRHGKHCGFNPSVPPMSEIEKNRTGRFWFFNSFRKKIHPVRQLESWNAQIRSNGPDDLDPPFGMSQFKARHDDACLPLDVPSPSMIRLISNVQSPRRSSWHAANHLLPNTPADPAHGQKPAARGSRRGGRFVSGVGLRAGAGGGDWVATTTTTTTGRACCRLGGIVSAVGRVPFGRDPRRA